MGVNEPVGYVYENKNRVLFVSLREISVDRLFDLYITSDSRAVYEYRLTTLDYLSI